jgi:hypothetical protein
MLDNTGRSTKWQNVHILAHLVLRLLSEENLPLRFHGFHLCSSSIQPWLEQYFLTKVWASEHGIMSSLIIYPPILLRHRNYTSTLENVFTFFCLLGLFFCTACTNVCIANTFFVYKLLSYSFVTARFCWTCNEMRCESCHVRN